jgi:hypothetical protein
MVIRFPLGLYQFNETQYAKITKAINLSLKMAEDPETGGTLSSNATLTSWDVKYVTEDAISVQLNFNQSMYISLSKVIPFGNYSVGSRLGQADTPGSRVLLVTQGKKHEL